MMRLYRIRLALLLGGATLAFDGVAAQIVGKTLAESGEQYDMTAIAPIIQGLLTEGRVGAVRDWTGSGKSGRVHLVDGGGTGRCGHVRTTLTRDGREGRGYTFRYCRDAAGIWRNDG